MRGGQIFAKANAEGAAPDTSRTGTAGTDSRDQRRYGSVQHQHMLGGGLEAGTACNKLHGQLEDIMFVEHNLQASSGW